MSDSPTRDAADGPPDQTQLYLGPFDAGELPVTPPGRYDLRGEIARGGMGVVLAARDTHLNREVAVKVLREEYRDRPAVARRFVEEARITGQLQHPHVPPVHDLGVLPDGRPFIAMKLIKGRTLADRLAAADRPALPQLVLVFEKVCETVAYAHSKRVIHRDLKPSNVMVGAFGEVQVMDWGLAKVLTGGPADPAPADAPDAPRDSVIETDRRADSATRAGAVLGTSAYMPPEQAQGEIDRTDARADVFALGAILCELLTGSPAYTGRDAEQVHRKAVFANLAEAFARLDGCGADADLVALARRCLAADPADRPATAAEVAFAVAEHRSGVEDRLRWAEVERAAAEARAAGQRKLRRVQLALAAAAVGLLGAVAFAAWVLEKMEARRQAQELAHWEELTIRKASTERDVAAALNEVRVLREEGLKQADDPDRWRLTLAAARSPLKQAKSAVAAADPVDDLLLARVVEAADDLGRDERDRALLAELDRIWEESDVHVFLPAGRSRESSDRYAAAFRGHGVDLTAVPVDEAAAWLKGHRFRDRLTAAVGDWVTVQPRRSTPDLDAGLIRPVVLSAAIAGEAAVVPALYARPLRDRLERILDLVTEDPFAREWWAAASRGDAAALARLLDRTEVARLSARRLAGLADELDVEPSHNARVLPDLLRLAYDRFPGEYWVNFRLGQQALQSPGRRGADDAVRHLSAAVAARPESVMARVGLGMALAEGRQDRAAGVRVIRGAAEIDPANPWPHLVLGALAVQAQDWTEATREFREGVRLEPDDGFFLVRTIVASQLIRPPAEKPRPDDEIVRMVSELVAARPDHPGGHALLAELRAGRGDPRGALAAYRAARAVMTPGFAQRSDVLSALEHLERIGRWDGKLPAVLGGELRPAGGSDYSDLAEYCATFERRYALAARFATDALAADPDLYADTFRVLKFAGWAVQAAAGNGTGATDLPADDRSRLRRQALGWLREALARAPESVRPLVPGQFRSHPDLAPVRGPKGLDQLPPDERAAWRQFWAAVRAAAPRPDRPERAPPPRPVGAKP